MIGEGLARRAITGVEMARDAGHSLAVAVAPSGRHIAADEVRERLETQPQRVWRLLAAHVTAEWLVGLLATALSIGFYIWYSQRGLTLAYGDAISHMNIARRVLIGRTPGIAQLGTAWPPFTHILMLPLIWNDTLYRSGLGGALPSMLAYVLGGVYIFRLGVACYGSHAAGWTAALVLMLNPSVLYMQSTPMTEMGLVCSAIIAIYYTLIWSRTFHAADLVKAAAAAAAGTLIRYDGWALALALAATVGFIAWRQRGRLYAESNLLLYGTLAFTGCVSWLIYNQVIFGDALSFLRGPYSSLYQQLKLLADRGVPTIGNVSLSLQTYATASVDSIGWWITILALAGLVYALISYHLYRYALPIFATLVPFVFNWLSLVRGTSVLATPEISFDGTHTFYNERYGMLMVPAAALFLAALASRSRFLRSGLLVVVMLLSIGGSLFEIPYALQDAMHGYQVKGQAEARQEAQWLSANYRGGSVLLSDSPFTLLKFYSKLPDSVFLVDANGSEFTDALADPPPSVTWIVMDSQSFTYDPVAVALGKRQDWRSAYVLSKVVGTTQIYERIATPTTPPHATTSAHATVPTVPQFHERRRGAVASAL